MRKNSSRVLLILGILFILFAIFGRYWVLPGYFETLESGGSQGSDIPADVNVWLVIRYLFWAYSFKLGVFSIVIGALLKTAMTLRRLSLYILGGVVYLGLAYLPIPGPYSLLFGIGGGIMSILIVLSFYLVAKERDDHSSRTETAAELRIIGYFFFAMATYNLCPLMGVKCFCLEPDKMIEYGLQADAASFASHLLIELVLGWVFVFWSHFAGSKRVARWTN